MRRVIAHGPHFATAIRFTGFLETDAAWDYALFAAKHALGLFEHSRTGHAPVRSTPFAGAHFLASAATSEILLATGREFNSGLTERKDFGPDCPALMDATYIPPEDTTMNKQLQILRLRLSYTVCAIQALQQLQCLPSGMPETLDATSPKEHDTLVIHPPEREKGTGHHGL